MAGLLDDRREAGTVTLVWNGRDDAGRDAGAGVYFLRLEAAGTTATRKIVRVP